MRILILGAGKMGSFFTDLLSFDHEVAVYDNDPQRLRFLYNTQRFTSLDEVDAFNPETDITVDKQSKSVSIVLPAPSITSFVINDVDEEYNVTTGARKAIKQEDRNMVVEQGRTEIENAIPELGILDEARASAVKRFTSLVEHLGFSHVNITFADQIKK